MLFGFAGAGCLGARPTVAPADGGSGSGGHTGGGGSGGGAGGHGVGGGNGLDGGVGTGGSTLGTGGSTLGTGGSTLGTGGAHGTGGSSTGGMTGTGGGCPTGETNCGTTCVNLTSDAAHCASCTHACTGGQMCTNSLCACGTGTLNCSGTCEDPATSNQCGTSCTAACAGPTTGASTGSANCNGSSCAITCATATPTNCSGGCVNLMTDTGNCGTCGHSCKFAGSKCSAGACAPTPIATGQTSPSWLTATGVRVYWINDSSSQSPAVNAANEDGTALTIGVPGVQPSTPGVVVFEGGNNPVFYMVDAGTTPSIFAGQGKMPLGSIPMGVAFDVVAGPPAVMYWTNPDVAAIQSMGTDGINQVFSPPVYSASIPIAIAIDSTSLYWTDVVGQPGTGKVSKAPIPADGNVGAGPVTSIATSLNVSGNARTLAVNATNAYFVCTINSLVSLVEVSINGGTKTTLATGSPDSVAADNAGVYWVDHVASAVYKVATGATTVVTLASGQPLPVLPGEIAVDAAGVYWGTTTAIMALAK